MIGLDTNYLIRCVELGTGEAARMEEWYRAGEQMVVPMAAWFESICGPLTRDQESAARAFHSDLLPFSETHAQEAASLFNAAGRNRSLRVDAMIAGTAIGAKARLATAKRDDFAPFLAYSLELV